MFLFESLIVYCLLTFCMYAFAMTAEHKKNPWLYNAIPIVLFTLVFGLRYGVGVDYANYLEIYENELDGISLADMLDSRYELGFIFLVALCKLFRLPVYFFFSFFSFLQIFLIYKSFKEEEGILKYIYLTLMLTGLAIVAFTNVLRQELAFCILLYALHQQLKNKKTQTFLWCIVACLFHKSAILFLPAFILWNRREQLFKHPVVECGILLICFASCLIGKVQELFSLLDKAMVLLGYEDYVNIAEEMTTNSKIGITRILGLATNLIVVWNSKHIKDFFNSTWCNRLYDLFFIGACCSYIFMGSMLFLRLVLYFTNFTFIGYAYALCYFTRTTRSIPICRLYLMVLLFGMFSSFSGLIMNGDKNTCGYVSYLQTSKHAIKDAQREEMMQDRSLGL